MTKGRWIIAGIVVAGVAAATVQGLRPRPPPPVEVTTSISKRGPITRLVTAAGHLQAHQTVKVSSNISGDLPDIPAQAVLPEDRGYPGVCPGVRVRKKEGPRVSTARV